MGEEGKSFGAILMASVAVIIGSKYLVTAMVVQLSPSEMDIPMLLDSVLVTAIGGVVLVVLAGAFVSAFTFTRAIGILSFTAIAIAGKPWVAPAEPMVIAESIVAAIAVVYLLLYDPIHESNRTEVDESTSATRIGSTLR